MGLTVKDSAGTEVNRVNAITLVGSTVTGGPDGQVTVTAAPTSAATNAAASAVAAAASAAAAAVSETNAAASAAAIAAVTIKVAKVALAAVDTAGGVFAWLNPEARDVLVVGVVVNTTTPATGACSLDIGVAANGTTKVDTLVDGLDVHTAAGAFDRSSQAGANGKTVRLAAVGQYVTGSVDSGASAGLVGSAFVLYTDA